MINFEREKAKALEYLLNTVSEVVRNSELFLPTKDVIEKLAMAERIYDHFGLAPFMKPENLLPAHTFENVRTAFETNKD